MREVGNLASAATARQSEDSASGEGQLSKEGQIGKELSAPPSKIVEGSMDDSRTAQIGNVLSAVDQLAESIATICRPHLHGKDAGRDGQIADAAFISTCLSHLQQALLPLAPPLEGGTEYFRANESHQILDAVTRLEDIVGFTCRIHKEISEAELLVVADDRAFLIECQEKFRIAAAKRIADMELPNKIELIEHYTKKATVAIQEIIEDVKKRRAGIYTPSELWSGRDRSRAEKPPNFIARVYREKLNGDFTRADLRRSDPKLDKALQNWFSYSNKGWPVDLPPLPMAKHSTKKPQSSGDGVAQKCEISHQGQV